MEKEWFEDEAILAMDLTQENPETYFIPENRYIESLINLKMDYCGPNLANDYIKREVKALADQFCATDKQTEEWEGALYEGEMDLTDSIIHIKTLTNV